MSDGVFPKSWSEALPYLAWAALVLPCAGAFFTAMFQGSYGQALAALVIGLGIAIVALHSKTWLERTSPNWVYVGALMLVLALLLSPFFEQKRWPLSISFQTQASPEEIAAAVVHAMPPLANGVNAEKIVEALRTANANLPVIPSTTEIAEAIVAKLNARAPDTSALMDQISSLNQQLST